MQFKTQEITDVISISISLITLDILRFALAKIHNEINKNDNLKLERKLLYEFIMFLNEIAYNESRTSKN